jgi:putative tricarboxylic transport membrane protein
MGRREKITLSCFLAFSIFVCEESWRLGLGNLNTPGPGFFPFAASAIIGVIAVILFVSGRKRAVVNAGPFFLRERLTKFLGIVGIIFCYGFMLDYIGFFLCTVLFVGVSVRVIEPKRWWVILVVSVGSAVAAWLLFDYWLMVQFPRGTWVGPISDRLWRLWWN